MKKFLLLGIFLCVTAMFAADARNGIKEAGLKKAISEFDSKEGVYVINLGPLGTSLARTIAKAAVKSTEDKQAVEVLNSIKSLKKAKIVVFEDSEQSVKDNFRKKLDKVLPEDSLLMEVKDEEDTVHIYGTVDESASVVKNLILYVPRDCVLLYLEGELSIDSLAQIAF